MTLLHQHIIQTHVSGLSFADVGGLWNTQNEMVSIALKSGARNAAMIDISASDSQWWEKFDERCQSMHLSEYSKFIGSIDDTNLINTVGTFDFVHCSGVIYHCPNPIWSLRRLRALTNRYLLIASMTLPSKITNRYGELELVRGACLLLPSMSNQTRKIINEHYRELEVGKIFHEDEMIWLDGLPDYGPWWWLWSSETLASMVQNCGFKILQMGESWEQRAHYVFAEKTP